MKNPKETLSEAMTAVKSKSRKGSEVITRSFLTLKDRAAANMAAFRKAQKSK